MTVIVYCGLVACEAFISIGSALAVLCSRSMVSFALAWHGAAERVVLELPRPQDVTVATLALAVVSSLGQPPSRCLPTIAKTWNSEDIIAFLDSVHYLLQFDV